MELIKVLGNKEGKTIVEALELLKENGFDVIETTGLRDFCEVEADYRFNEMDIIGDEEKSDLTDEEIEKIISLTADEYFHRDIFDYDYLDDILRSSYKDVINDRNKNH